MDRHWRRTLGWMTAAALAAAPLLAADGDLDPSFGGGDGIQQVQIGGATVFELSGLHLADIEDGGFTVAGSVSFGTASDSDFASCLVGRNGGIQDCTAFGFDLGGTNTDLCNGVGYQLDGRRVLVGQAAGTGADPDDRMALLGLDSTNVLDSSFGSGGRKVIDFAGAASLDAVAARRNGDLVVAGGYDTDPGVGNYDCLVGRLHADGTLDTGFSGNGMATISWDLGGTNLDFCEAETLYGDGRVLAAAEVSRSDGSRDIGLARLTADGQLDDTFSGNGKTIIAFDQGGYDDDLPGVVALDRFERIVVAALVSTPGGARVGLVRLHPGGGLDGSFGGGGKVTFSMSATSDDIAGVIGLAILPPPSNDILVSGDYKPDIGSFNFLPFVAAFHQDGTPDTSFGNGGKVSLTVPGASEFQIGGYLAMQGGKVLLGGSWSRFASASEQASFWLARLYRNQISGDDFEGGNLRLWSNHADP